MNAVCHQRNTNITGKNQHQHKGIAIVIRGLDGHFRRPGSLDFSPVDAFQKHRQLCATELHGATVGLRPDESATLQSLGKKAETIAIPPQQLYDVASPSAERENMAREWLLLERVLHLRAQPIEAATEIRHAGRNPDLRPGWRLDHLRRLSRINRTSEGSAPLSTLIVTRSSSSM
jgi:hypothetical protein